VSAAFVAIVGLAACGGASAKAEVGGSGEGKVEAGGSVDVEPSGAADGSGPDGASTTSQEPIAAEPMPEYVDGTDPVAEDADLPTQAAGPTEATLPAFQMLRGDRSVVFLRLSGRVPVTETRAGGRLVYRMPGVRVPARTNQLDLPTAYFTSPVGRVHLLQVGADAELIVELRARVRPAARLRRSGSGAVLRLEFPRFDPGRVPEQAVLQEASAQDTRAQETP
jgi:hypothetical protein